MERDKREEGQATEPRLSVLSPYDNAVVESWFKTLKAELGSRFNNHTHAKDELFDYIEVFYNQQRRHSAIGYVSPAEYERATAVRQAA